MKTKLKLKKALLTCPGDTIAEHINYIDMPKEELSKQLKRSLPQLESLLNGTMAINQEIATRLENALNIPASFWLNLEHTYREEIKVLNSIK